jgi:hypothetical protein
MRATLYSSLCFSTSVFRRGRRICVRKALKRLSKTREGMRIFVVLAEHWSPPFNILLQVEVMRARALSRQYVFWTRSG